MGYVNFCKTVYVTEERLNLTNRVITALTSLNKMAKKMDEKNLKRRRVNGTHRWSDVETLHLVQEVAEEVKDKPESFEKPTAQFFYKKICNKSAVLNSIEWVPMKNKMRHLKATYMSALNWKNQTGAGLLASGNESSVEEYIAKICPKWNHLEQIFGQRRGVNPTFILETSVESVETDNVIEDTNFLDSNSVDDCLEISENENATISSPEPSPNSQSSLDATSLKETMKKFQQSTPKSKNVNPFSLLLSLQEKRLDIEVKKFELEKVKLEQDFEIRKRQVESEERIKKYEIEIKYKSATE